jgi:acetyl-CoA C-acetyltransferase
VHSRPHITVFRAVKAAAKDAFKKADVTPKDVDLFEVHDSFSICEIMAAEDLGLVEKGQGGPALSQGRFNKDGEFPINPSGGLKAKGHPVGATGVAQIVEVVEQLRDTAGGRQIKGAKKGLALNLGGTGSTAVVHILSKD